MATLHVRNVPESLYEQLRARSAVNGRSIGAEVVQLLEHGLAGELAHRPPWLADRRRRRPATPFARFTEPGRVAVAAAQDEARALGHGHVGTGHLLLGLLAEGEGAGAASLLTLGLTLERARQEVAQRTPAAGGEPPARMPFDPGAKKALELALREAAALRHSSIGTEHLLLGVVREGEGAGAQVVALVEPDVDAVRRCVARAVVEASAPAVPAPPVDPEFRVVELSGSAADWEALLNETAADGFELVEVVGGRAIFRD